MDAKPLYQKGQEVWAVAYDGGVAQCPICSGSGFFACTYSGFLIYADCKCNDGWVVKAEWGFRRITIDAVEKRVTKDMRGVKMWAWVYTDEGDSCEEYFEHLVFSAKEDAIRCCRELNKKPGGDMAENLVRACRGLLGTDKEYARRQAREAIESYDAERCDQ